MNDQTAAITIRNFEILSLITRKDMIYRYRLRDFDMAENNKL